MSNLEECMIGEERASTDWYEIGAGGLPVTIVSSGDWTGKITLQVLFDGNDEPKNYGPSYNKNFTFNQRLPNGSKVRAIFLDGDYVSGSAVIDITQ